jgi:hypothetical protein
MITLSKQKKIVCAENNNTVVMKAETGIHFGFIRTFSSGSLPHDSNNKISSFEILGCSVYDSTCGFYGLNGLKL